MKNLQQEVRWFIAISVGILSVAAIWLFAMMHDGQKRSLGGLDWEVLTSTERAALFVRLRGDQKGSILIECNRADCSELANSLIQVFVRVGWSVGFRDAEETAAGLIGIKIEPCLDRGLELWDAINTMTSLHPVLGCSSHPTSPKQTILVIGTKRPHAGS